MLTKEETVLLTEVGPGTLMGNLLRRYWTPACLSSELPEPETTLRVRLLGEDLVAFRNSEGQIGLLGEHCPHRGASIYYGRNEEAGLRCVYHGWKFDISGQCIDMPSEKRSFADQIQATAYSTHESGGIVWTYMGPNETMTPFRDFGSESLPADEISVMKNHTSCNWLQSMEGNLDTSHISYLHQFNGIDEIPDDGTDRPGYPSNAMALKFWRHDGQPRLELQDEWYGFRYAGLRETPNGHTHVRLTAYVIPYGTLTPAVPFTANQALFVPIDDENTWRYRFATQPTTNPHNYGGPSWRTTVPGYDRDPASKSAGSGGLVAREKTAANEYGIDRDVQRTFSFTGIAEFTSQDQMVTETMGPVYDRISEHLGTTDLAIIKMRSLLLESAMALAEGLEPPAIGGDLDYRSIRGAEKVLGPGEDWRVLGTDADESVQETLLER